MRAVAEADRGRGARDFLLRHDMLEIAEAKPAIFLLDGDPVEPELAHLRPQVAREFVLLVDLGGDRRDLVAREPLGRVADRVGHFAEVEFKSLFGHVAALLFGSALARARRHLNKAAARLCAAQHSHPVR